MANNKILELLASLVGAPPPAQDVAAGSITERANAPYDGLSKIRPSSGDRIGAVGDTMPRETMSGEVPIGIMKTVAPRTFKGILNASRLAGNPAVKAMEKAFAASQDMKYAPRMYGEYGPGQTYATKAEKAAADAAEKLWRNRR